MENISSFLWKIYPAFSGKYIQLYESKALKKKIEINEGTD